MIKKEKIKTITLVLFAIIIFCLIIYIFILKIFFKTDEDYQKLGLELNFNNIDYYTIYDEDAFGNYKVYKLNTFGENAKLRDKLEKNDYWSKNKFYEYVMMRFYEKEGKETVQLSREDLYYYNKDGVYAIFDLKNEKIYYLKNYLYSSHNNYSDILGIETKNYIEREIYSVRGGPQNDGLDYYTYEFSEEIGKEIIETLEMNSKWSKNRLDDDILDDFEYNNEVLSIENGYYHYELVCRTSDENKKYNFTEKEATGWEIGVYDADKNILYYYWQSI